MTYKEVRELEALPERINELEMEKETLHLTLADPNYYRTAKDAVAKLTARLAQLELELAEAYRRWEELEAVRGHSPSLRLARCSVAGLRPQAVTVCRLTKRHQTGQIFTLTGQIEYHHREDWMKKVVLPALLARARPRNVLAWPLTAGAAGKPVELNYSLFFPATHGHTLLATEWAREVEKRSDNAVKITIFPGATLTPADQTYDGVVNGIADIGMSVLAYSKGRFPLTEVLDLPLGYASGLQATRLANAYYARFQPKELADVKVMYLMAHGPGILHTKKPVEKLEDLKGMKIRCTGGSSRIVAALGATPVAMPQNEAYDALQKGVVDGLVSPIETLKGWKFAEVVKYTTRNIGSSYSLGFFVAMNRQKWDVAAEGGPGRDRGGQPRVRRPRRQGVGRLRQGRHRVRASARA